MPEQDIIHRAKEIFDIGSKRMRAIFLQVFALGLPYLLDALRHIGIIRRYQPRLELHPLFLKIFWIRLEERLAQRPDANQLQVTLEPVDQHGKLVQPGFPKKPSPAGYPEIVLDLAARLELVLVENILVQVFGERVHGAQFINMNNLSAFPQTPLAEDGAIGWPGIVSWLLGFLGDEIIEMVDRSQADHFKAAIIQPAQDLGAGKDALLSF